MKKVLLSTVALAAFTGGSLAADLPSRKEAPVALATQPMWTGFYAGLNAGYGFGTNSPTNSFNYGAQKSFLNVLATPGAVSSAFSNSANGSQNGFLGGFQFGYNQQIGQNFILGIETDIQGANIFGSSKGAGFGGFADSDTIAPITGTENGTVIGGQSISAGIDYIGTVRARAGYLIMPTMMVYGTAGFSYGGAYARVNNYGIESISAGFSDTNAGLSASMLGANTYVGSNRQSQLLTGWNAGGGAEWMFMPNWSLKGEAIYWNLGNMNVSTSTLALSPLSSATASSGGSSVTAPVTSHAVAPGLTKVNYQGVFVRAGLNYHLNWLGANQNKSAGEAINIEPQSWGGVYAGLNAGYSFGANASVSSVNYGAQRTVFDIPGSPSAVANALSFNSNNSQNGYLGGMQIGYNYLINNSYLVGLETDIQGANIFGSSYSRRGGLYSESDVIGPITGSANGAVLGSQVADAGVSYLGTLRGRLGYMISPALLVYGTAGFSYGGAFAKVNNYAIDSLSATASSGSGSATALLVSTYHGDNSQSQLLTGWNAGGGFEWMFQPNWSLKTEAIYWNLGNMNVSTNSVAVSPVNSVSVGGNSIPFITNSIASGITTINYQGVIARAGINHHFTMSSSPVAAKF